METLRADSVSDLIQKLLYRYGIAQKSPSPIDEAHVLLTSKTKECRRLEQRVKQLQFQNAQLRYQNQMWLSKSQRAETNAQQLAEVRKRLLIFENAFREQEDCVGELKAMLNKKEEKVKDIIEDYEKQLEQLRNQKPKFDAQDETRKEIEDLKAQLQLQENMIMSLMGNNTKLKDENKVLKRRIE